MKALVTALASLTLGSTLLLATDSEGSFDKSLSVSGPVELDAKTDSGGLTIIAGNAGTVHIHAYLKAQNGWLASSNDVERRIRELEEHPPIEQNGNHVRVGYAPSQLLRNISLRIEIETPPDTQVHARVDSGGIHIRGVQGQVDCKADSGGIDIDEVGSGVHAEADSGGIHIRSVKGGVFARVDSGGIRATDVAGPLDVEADSGHIEVSQTIPASIHAKADSGGINVTLARNAGYDITAEAESGHISVPELTTNAAFSRHHIEGKLRGGGPLVSIHVDSGGITVD